jgi:hypothetical protein
MQRGRILVTADPTELQTDPAGVVDVFAALSRQFYWADTVIVGSEQAWGEDECEVLEGEIVA